MRTQAYGVSLILCASESVLIGPEKIRKAPSCKPLLINSGAPQCISSYLPPFRLSFATACP